MALAMLMLYKPPSFSVTYNPMGLSEFLILYGAHYESKGGAFGSFMKNLQVYAITCLNVHLHKDCNRQ